VAVTAIGARRRITALFWLGWSPETLAAATELSERVFRWTPHELKRGCAQDLLDRIGGAYDQLWDTPPPARTAEERAAAAASARHAREVGWAPPMAYDDDEIDKPDGGLVPGWKRPETPVPRGGGLIDDIGFLRTAGYRDAAPRVLAERLGRSKAAVSRAITRHRRAERLAAAVRADAEAEAS
jgi:hypothetical protein